MTANKDNKVDVELDLDVETIALLEKTAKERNITVDELVEEALTWFIDKYDREEKERAFGEDTH